MGVFPTGIYIHSIDESARAAVTKIQGEFTQKNKAAPQKEKGLAEAPFFEMPARKGIRINNFVVIFILIWTGLAAPLMYEQKKTKPVNSLGSIRLI